MSFGGFGGGFGSNTNQSSGFGGFGANNPTTTTGGFGSTGSGFGSTPTPAATGGGLFGSTTNTGGFGGSGFGASTGFGAKPAFGATTTTSGGGLFGATTATAPAGGFGGGFGTNTASTSTGFGATGSTSLFGGSKPATAGFGSTTTSGFGGGTGGSIFGGSGNTATGTFGATTNPGIGVNVGDPPGTAVVPFAATNEKETNNPSQSNAFQNVLFMDAYKKWSAEELRLVDYNQGRTKATTGGTGTFGGTTFGGTTTGFGSTAQANTGGFGSTSGGLFGSTQPAASTPFGGATNTATGGFGGSGGLFGSKPAATTGGLFGGATAQPAATGGGLFGGGTTGGFGTAANTGTTGFGANNTTTTGGGLFGSTAANTAKPGGFSFGATGATGFGNTGAATTGFGASTATPAAGGGLFGNTAQTNTTGGGLFGGQQPAAGTTTGFGAQQQNTGGGLFGAAKPAGSLFGSSTAAAPAVGGLFGGSANNTTGFGGAASTTPQAGGLFGAKPAATGTGLFGNTAQTGQPGGSLFGGLGGAAQTQQPAQTGSLFGGMNQNTAAKPSLFGGQQSTGGGLFGGQPAQQQAGGSLFGSMNQQPQGGLGTSILGASQNQAQQPSFSTSINDISAYGSTTLFSGLSDDKIQNPGPLATPLSVKSKAKSRSILPMYKLSPANASRFATPQKRGYGFSYSNYGSPSSPSSVVSTPGGLGQSLLMGSIGRNGLSKSVSASNLRRSFNVEDSILAPGAFSASTSARIAGGSGNHKRLVISRDMRSDLFTAPTPKETLTPESAAGARKLSKRVSFDTSTAEPANSEPVAAPSGPETITPSTQLNGLASSNGINGSKPASGSPEMEQVKGKELAIVHEEESPAHVRSKRPGGIVPGEYWMFPSKEQLRALNRQQLKSVSSFTVGRENVGSVEFKVPVDLSGIDLDNLFDQLVILEPRTATVYPVAAKKPPVGRGLNVPSRITLEHSYPRGGVNTGLAKLEKHIQKLRSIPDTTFEDYDRETGVWTFSVEHFTTYGLDDDEDETEVDMTVGELPQVPTDAKDATSSGTDPDDTFDFRRSRRHLPGTFDEGAISDEELDAAQPPALTYESDAAAQPHDYSEDESMEGGQDDYQYEAFQQSSPHGSDDEHQDDLAVSRYAENDVQVPAGIMRARMRAVKKSTAPTKIEVAGGDDWTQILQASVRAPRTVDRATLRAQNESGAAWDLKDRGSPAPQKTQASDGAGFATSIDLMKSLFEQAKGPTQPVQASPAKGFVKWPYQQRPKVDSEDAPPVSRPNWGPNELLVTAHDNETNMQAVESNEGPALSQRDISQLKQYIDNSLTNEGDGIDSPELLRNLAQGDSVWEVASLLFDEDGVNLPAFWKALVADATTQALSRITTPEEKAIVCLAGNRVADACAHLLAAKNFRLATLVSTIGKPNKDIRTQLKDWRESNVLAEFSEPIRAIYELVAGNAGVCAGVKNVAPEHRINSFTISQRFGLDWMQAFALRLFYATSKTGGNGADVAEAVRAFQADIEQDKEPEPDSAMWSLLKIFAYRQYDWSDTRLSWLLTKTIYQTGKVSFGPEAAEKLDRASLSFASTLTAQSHWVPATFVLLQLSEPSPREAAVRDHLGRHAHLMGSPQKDDSPFSTLRKFGVPENWIWEAKALDFRSKQDSRQEFLALVWAGNYTEANHTFLNRVGPDLVIERDFRRLFTYAELLYKVKKHLSDWDRGAAVYLLYPMARLPPSGGRKQQADRFDDLLFDGLMALRGATHGNIRQEAAIADMAEELIKVKGGDARLYQLLPEDMRARYMRAQALNNIR
ncbi:hypothetical protein OQA88_10206 [Cercophora sp. LCS_1]